MKKIVILLFLLIFCCINYGFTQNNRAVEKVKEAVVKYKMRSFSEALELLKSASEIDSIYAEPYYWMGMIYLEQNNIEQAKKYAKKAFGLQRHEEKFATLLSVIDLQDAVQAAKQNDIDKAVSIADGIIEKNEKFIEGYIFKVDLFIKNNKFKEALEVFSVVEKLADRGALNQGEDKYVDLACQKALILFKQNQYGEAIILIERFKKSARENSKVKELYDLICSDKNPYFKNFNDGKKAYEAKDYANAKTFFQKAKKFAASGEVDKYLSDIDNQLKSRELYAEAEKLFADGKYQEAILKIGDANQFFQLPEAETLRQKAEAKLDEKATIAAHGEDAVIDPEQRKKKNASLYFNQAKSNFKNKQYSAAKDYIERVLKIYPDNKNALKLQEQILEQMKAVVGVLKTFEDAVKAYKNQQWSEALKMFEECRDKPEVKRNIESIKIPIYITHCNFELKNYAKAKADAAVQLGTVPDEDEKLYAILAHCSYFESGETPDKDFSKYLARLKNAKLPFAKQIETRINKAEEELAAKEASSEKWFYTWVGLGLCALFFFGFIAKNVISDMMQKKSVVAARKDDELDNFVAAKKGKAPSLNAEQLKKLKLAKTLYEKAAYDKAIETLSEILFVDPDNKNGLLIAGMSYIKTNNFSADNMNIFEKLTKLFPDNIDVLKGLCECYIAANKFTPTLFTAIKKVLEKEPDHAKFKEILEQRG